MSDETTKAVVAKFMWCVLVECRACGNQWKVKPRVDDLLPPDWWHCQNCRRAASRQRFLAQTEATDEVSSARKENRATLSISRAM